MGQTIIIIHPSIPSQPLYPHHPAEFTYIQLPAIHCLPYLHPNPQWCSAADSQACLMHYQGFPVLKFVFYHTTVVENANKMQENCFVLVCNLQCKCEQNAMHKLIQSITLHYSSSYLPAAWARPWIDSRRGKNVGTAEKSSRLCWIWIKTCKNNWECRAWFQNGLDEMVLSWKYKIYSLCNETIVFYYLLCVADCLGRIWKAKKWIILHIILFW